MSARRWMLLAIATILFGVAALVLHGLVMMGDCYPEEPIYSRCLADQARIGRNVLIVAGLAYMPVVWLIVRVRRRPHSTR